MGDDVGRDDGSQGNLEGSARELGFGNPQGWGFITIT